MSNIIKNNFQIKFKQLCESEAIKWFYRIIFVLLVFSQIFFGATTATWTSPFSQFAQWWINFVRHYAVYIVIVLCLFMKKFTVRELKWYMGLLVFFTLFTHVRFFRWESIYFLTVAMLIKDEDDEWLSKTLFWLFLSTFILILGLTYFDVIESIIRYRPDGFPRISLGFQHPNRTGAMVLTIFITYLLKRKENPSLIILASFVPIFMILNTWIDSRTGLLIIMAMFVFIILAKIVEKKCSEFNFLSKYKKLYIWFLPSFFLIASYLLSLIYTHENSVLNLLNRLFSGRLVLGRTFVEDYPVTLFGVDVYMNARNPQSVALNGFRFLDNGFLVSLLTLGLILTILRLVYFSWLAHNMVVRRYKYALVIFTAVMFFGFMENLVWSATWNTMFLYGGIFLKQSEKMNA